MARGRTATERMNLFNRDVVLRATNMFVTSNDGEWWTRELFLALLCSPEDDKTRILIEKMHLHN